MQSPIKIQKEGRHINVTFEYNTDLVEIMREQGGWWVRKNKSWMFPASRLSKLREELVSKKYKVEILPEKQVEKKEFDQTKLFKNPDVVAIYDKCKVCGRQRSVGKDGICTECWVKSKK